MAATVVFSGGSKAMAHNLDDQYQRWMLRREEAVQENPYANPEIGVEHFVPDLPKLETRVQAVELRKLLTDKQIYAQEALAHLNAQYQSDEIVRGEYEQRRAPLAHAVNKINMQGRIVNAYLKDGQEHPFNPGFRIRELKRKGNDALTVEEQLELAALRNEEGAKARVGMERAISTESDLERRYAQLENYTETLRKDLISVQNKLLTAYERIIELQAAQQQGDE